MFFKSSKDVFTTSKYLILICRIVIYLKFFFNFLKKIRDICRNLIKYLLFKLKFILTGANVIES